ncbi:YcjF family protein [Candidatus Xianfuyuplasma coldseepsis]|uniref:YcjF family protein n=1 Tax=Candidatus Xianfuyuplasma coldseepsis TaxID=2782163 RepID=A0A7L7KSA7_9MOLU|nr:YcjF family protein [Xianfuyuplasma coldseepsis]QMS85701.1 YcjF family protein [Xianfuyuplasma coldseepsis]
MGKKRFWILIGIGAFIVIFFILLSNVLDVGVKLREISPYVEYTFYGISILLFYVLIVNPIRVIALSPTFTVDAMLTDDTKRHKIYKDATQVLLKNNRLTDDDKELLKGSMNNHEELRNSLQTVFETTLKNEMNEVIVRNAKSVLVTTALSQNGNLDMLSVLAINLKMIREIVEVSGFRPSYPYLGKLSLNVMVTSLIAEGIEDIDMTEYMPTKIGETLTDIPFLKTISSSLIGGIANSLLTCRVGIITQKYLYNDNQLLDKKQIRRNAYKESVKLMPRIISEGLVAFPKGVASIFSRPFKKAAKKEENE